MRKLITILLFLGFSIIGKSQTLGFKPGEYRIENGVAYWHEYSKTRDSTGEIDTVKAVFLCSGKDIANTVFIRKGFVVRQKSINPPWQSDYATTHIERWVPIKYLDIDKNEFNSDLIIWQYKAL